MKWIYNYKSCQIVELVTEFLLNFCAWKSKGKDILSR